MNNPRPNDNFTGKFVAYILSNSKPPDFMSIPSNIFVGMMLCYIHPEYAQILINEMPEEIFNSGKEAVDEIVKDLPFEGQI